MTPRLEGRVALVTGSGRGIGPAVARRLAAEGATVIVNDIDEDVAEETAEMLRGVGATVATFAGDVTASDFGEGMATLAMRQFGAIDIVANNARYTWDATIQKTSDEQFQAMLDVHLVAPFRPLRAVQPHLRALHREDLAAGRRRVRKIVNVSSLSGTGGSAGQVSYATAKSGVSGMTKSLAKEWGRYDMTVNAVAFGLIDTRLTAEIVQETQIEVGDRMVKVGVSPELRRAAAEQVPLRRTGSAEDAAGAITLFTYPESDYISGQVVLCAGGYVM